MNLIVNLIQALEHKDIESIEECLAHLTVHQSKQEDSSPIEKLKNTVVQLLENAGENEDFIDFGQKIYDKKVIEACYFLRIVMNDPFKKMITLPFLKNDLAFLQKLHYIAYAKEMPQINSIILSQLYARYEHEVNFDTEDVKPNTQTIPLNFHYIWAGETMPDEEVKNLSAMIAVAKKNNGKIFMWTNHPARQESIFNLLPASHHQYIEVKNISELYPLMDQHLGAAANVMKSFIQEEMEGFKNYAAMSDLVRMLILYFYGGIYLDGDIHLKFNSERKIGNIDSDIAFKQLMSFHAYTPDTPSPRNDILMSSALHPVLREALKMWLILLHEQQAHALPHRSTNTVGFVSTFKDQRRFGQSHYESNCQMPKPKEIGTGNLGVMPIDVALNGFIQKYNAVNHTHKTVKDCAFGYKMVIPDFFKMVISGIFKPGEITREIRLGNLVFDHIMAHKWLGDKKKKSVEF